MLYYYPYPCKLSHFVEISDVLVQMFVGKELELEKYEEFNLVLNNNKLSNYDPVESFVYFRVLSKAYRNSTTES